MTEPHGALDHGPGRQVVSVFEDRSRGLAEDALDRGGHGDRDIRCSLHLDQRPQSRYAARDEELCIRDCRQPGLDGDTAREQVAAQVDGSLLGEIHRSEVG